jgi:hypothetical protein
MKSQIPFARHCHPTLEQGDGVAEFSPRDIEIAESPGREGQAVGVIERLSEAEAFLAAGDPFPELTSVGNSPSQIAVGQHGRKSGEAKPLSAPITF